MKSGGTGGGGRVGGRRRCCRQAREDSLWSRKRQKAIRHFTLVYLTNIKCPGVGGRSKDQKASQRFGTGVRRVGYASPVDRQLWL